MKLFILILLFFGSRVLAYDQSVTEFQKEVSSSELKPWSVITNLPGDYKYWFTDTFRSANAVMITGILVSTAGLVITDYGTWRTFDSPYHQSGVYKSFSDASVFAGDGFFQFGIAGAFLGSGLISKNNIALRTSEQIVEAILATGIVVQILKHTTGREDPSYATTETGQWNLLPNQADYMHRVAAYDAMPSGHLATAMTTLTVIQANYPGEKWIPYVGYPALGFIAVGLVSAGLHWWSDYPLALGLGYSFGKSVTRKNITQDTTPFLSPVLMPVSTPRGNLVTLNWKW